MIAQQDHDSTHKIRVCATLEHASQRGYVGDSRRSNGKTAATTNRDGLNRTTQCLEYVVGLNIENAEPNVNDVPSQRYDPREDRDAQLWARGLADDNGGSISSIEEILEEQRRRDRNITRIPDIVNDERLHFSQGTTRFYEAKNDYFPNKYYKQESVEREIWPDFFGCSHEARDHKKDGPWITQGLFERLDDRHAVNARVNYFLIFDIDDGMTFDEVVATMRARQIPCVVTTTWSHQMPKNGVTCDRMRVIIPLRTPFDFFLPAISTFGVKCPAPLDITWLRGHGVWPRMYLNIAADFGFKVDETCKDPSRLFYLPARPIGSKCLARRCIIGVKSQWPYFDWTPYAPNAIEAELARLAKIEERKQLAAALREFPDEDDARDIDAEIKEIEDALAVIDPDLDYGKWRDLLFALHNGYGSSARADAVLDMYITWSAGGTKFDDGTEEQITRMWENADPDGSITMGTFWHIAKNYGYRRKAKPSVVTPVVEVGAFAEIARRFRRT